MNAHCSYMLCTQISKNSLSPQIHINDGMSSEIHIMEQPIVFEGLTSVEHISGSESLQELNMNLSGK